MPTEAFGELCSVVAVEELQNRNCFGFNLVIFLCAMALLKRTWSPKLHHICHSEVHSKQRSCHLVLTLWGQSRKAKLVNLDLPLQAWIGEREHCH